MTSHIFQNKGDATKFTLQWTFVSIFMSSQQTFIRAAYLYPCILVHISSLLRFWPFTIPNKVNFQYYEYEFVSITSRSTSKYNPREYNTRKLSIVANTILISIIHQLSNFLVPITTTSSHDKMENAATGRETLSWKMENYKNILRWCGWFVTKVYYNDSWKVHVV